MILKNIDNNRVGVKVQHFAKSWIGSMSSVEKGLESWTWFTSDWSLVFNIQLRYKRLTNGNQQPNLLRSGKVMYRVHNFVHMLLQTFVLHTVKLCTKRRSFCLHWKKKKNFQTSFSRSHFSASILQQISLTSILNQKSPILPFLSPKKAHSFHLSPKKKCSSCQYFCFWIFVIRYIYLTISKSVYDFIVKII